MRTILIILGGVVLCAAFLAAARWFYFLQAEDGIRSPLVTGVQTCALPIFVARPRGACRRPEESARLVGREHEDPRSEERRVGKSVDLGGRRIINKKKA